MLELDLEPEPDPVSKPELDLYPELDPQSGLELAEVRFFGFANAYGREGRVAQSEPFSR